MCPHVGNVSEKQTLFSRSKFHLILISPVENETGSPCMNLANPRSGKPTCKNSGLYENHEDFSVRTTAERFIFPCHHGKACWVKELAHLALAVE
jgi:hypothetical protein